MDEVAEEDADDKPEIDGRDRLDSFTGGEDVEAQDDDRRGDHAEEQKCGIMRLARRLGELDAEPGHDQDEDRPDENQKHGEKNLGVVTRGG